MLNLDGPCPDTTGVAAAAAMHRSMDRMDGQTSVLEASPARRPTPLEVRLTIPQALRSRHTLKGLSIFVLVAGVHLGLFAAGLAASSIYVKFVLGAWLGLATGVLFVVGHDASHGSLTPHPRLNLWIARLAFLPSLHPECTWATGHNRLHHGWTNLVDKDPSYPPLSLEQFEALPAWRSVFYRSYQTLWGFGLYYLFEVWLKCQILCRRPGFTEGLKPARMLTDYVLVASYAAFAFLTSFAVGGWITCLAMVVVPFVVWNYLMAFVTMQHHTHPRVKWYRDRSGWSFYEAQVRGTVHIVPPRIIDVLFARIFQHTAHHIDKAIPLYNLARAQQSLVPAYSDDVIKVRMSLKHFAMLLRECQLYDFNQSRWRRFPVAGQRAVRDPLATRTTDATQGVD